MTWNTFSLTQTAGILEYYKYVRLRDLTLRYSKKLYRNHQQQCTISSRICERPKHPKHLVLSWGDRLSLGQQAPAPSQPSRHPPPSPARLPREPLLLRCLAPRPQQALPLQLVQLQRPQLAAPLLLQQGRPLQHQQMSLQLSLQRQRRQQLAQGEADHHQPAALR